MLSDHNYAHFASVVTAVILQDIEIHVFQNARTCLVEFAPCGMQYKSHAISPGGPRDAAVNFKSQGSTEPEEGPPAPPGRGGGLTHAQGPHVV